MQRTLTAKWLLVAALAIVFGWFGIDKFLSPFLWIQWIPPWFEGLLTLTRDQWLSVIGAIEIVFAALLLIPVRRIQLVAASLIALQLVGVLTQTGWNDIGVRDLGLLLSSVALLFLL